MGDMDPEVRFANVLVLQDLVGIEGKEKSEFGTKRNLWTQHKSDYFLLIDVADNKIVQKGLQFSGLQLVPKCR